MNTYDQKEDSELAEDRDTALCDSCMQEAVLRHTWDNGWLCPDCLAVLED